MFITDGTGRGYQGEVDSTNKFATRSVDQSFEAEASKNGDSYNINTGILTLTSANKSAVIYLKNNESRDLIITNLFYLIGNSTGGSGDVLITVLRNPTTGTIIDNATDVEMNVNRNFGSPKTLASNAYKGAEGYTFTNGTKVIESIFNQSAQRAALGVGTIILGKSNSIGIEMTPATGNTSLDVEFAIGCHLEVAL